MKRGTSGSGTSGPGSTPQREQLQRDAVLPHPRRQHRGAAAPPARRWSSAPSAAPCRTPAGPRRARPPVRILVPLPAAPRSSVGALRSRQPAAADDERQPRQRRCHVVHHDRDPGVRRRQQHRRGHASAQPRHARSAIADARREIRVPSTSRSATREHQRCARHRCASSPPIAAAPPAADRARDIAHDAAGPVPLQPRRELARDVDDNLGGTRRTEAGEEGVHGFRRIREPDDRAGGSSMAAEEAGAVRGSGPARTRESRSGVRVRGRSMASQRDAAGAARQMIGPHEQRDRLAALDHARHPQPGGERERAQRRSGTSERSSATTPKLPACSTRFVALSARARVTGPADPQQTRRSSPSAAPTPDRTDRTDRPARPLRPRTPRPPAHGTDTVVRPDDRAPTISDRCPRGSPPPSAASIDGTPVAARFAVGAPAATQRREVVSVTSSFRAPQQAIRVGRGRSWQATTFALFSPTP